MANEFPFWNFVESASLQSNFKTTVQRAESGVRFASGALGHYFTATLSLRRMDHFAINRIFAWMHKFQGRLNTFKLVFPNWLSINQPQTYTGSIVVNGANQTGLQVAVDGMDVSSTILRAGAYIKFETTSNKVYILTEDLRSDGSGEGTLNLGSLVLDNSPNDGENVIYKDVEWTFALAEDITGFDLDVLKRGGFEMQLEEVWNA